MLGAQFVYVLKLATAREIGLGLSNYFCSVKQEIANQ